MAGRIYTADYIPFISPILFTTLFSYRCARGCCTRIRGQPRGDEAMPGQAKTLWQWSCFCFERTPLWTDQYASFSCDVPLAEITL